MDFANDSEVLTSILSELRLKWITLNDKCKTLQSSLTEATTKSEELEIKLTQSLEQATKVEKENKRLKITVKKLQKKILTGSVHKLISALKQNISVYDNTVLPKISKLTKSAIGSDDDLDISSSEDENDVCLSVLDNHRSASVDGSSKSIETCVNHVDVSKSVQNEISSTTSLNTRLNIDISDIESCVIEEEEHILKSGASTPVESNVVASLKKTPSFSSNETPPLDQRNKTQKISNNNNNCQEKAAKKEVTVLKPSDISVIVLPPSNIADISCSSVEVKTNESEINHSEQLKRPCSSTSDLDESLSKPNKKLKTSTKTWKCLICEYEDIEGLNEKTYETRLDLDQHIIESHPNPTPCYIPCMFNDGKCSRHFQPKQNFDKHVKRAHSREDVNFIFSKSQRKPLKCVTCSKLFLFESDLNEHIAQAHRLCSDKKTPNLCNKRSKVTAECEICKKENHSSVKYRLYDKLDSHIAKCHSDPFPDYLRCPYCTRHFKLVVWLTQHIVKKHPNSYSDSPLEKFLHNQQYHSLLESVQEIMEDVDMESNNTKKPTPTESCPLRILSPSSINKSISIKSMASNVL